MLTIRVEMARIWIDFEYPHFFMNTNSDSNILVCECKMNISNSHSDIYSICAISILFFMDGFRRTKSLILKYDHAYEDCGSKVTYLSIIILINKYINNKLN